jgi:type IV pilus assembly protein PilP
MVDPFVPRPIVVAQAAGNAAAAGWRSAADLNRPKSRSKRSRWMPIQMVGTLAQNKDMYALVRAGTNLFRVKKGNYMGQNFGPDHGCREGQINLKEVVQDSGGEWVERSTLLQMSEGKK